MWIYFIYYTSVVLKENHLYWLHALCVLSKCDNATSIMYDCALRCSCEADAAHSYVEYIFHWTFIVVLVSYIKRGIIVVKVFVWRWDWLLMMMVQNCSIEKKTSNKINWLYYTTQPEGYIFGVFFWSALENDQLMWFKFIRESFWK